MKKQNKKFKILAAGDFHGDSDTAKKLAEKAEKENVDLVILTGDITGLIETENLIKPFKDKKQKVVFFKKGFSVTEEKGLAGKECYSGLIYVSSPLEAGLGTVSNDRLCHSREGGCVVMSFRGDSRGILILQVLVIQRFLALLEMTHYPKPLL